MSTSENNQEKELYSNEVIELFNSGAARATKLVKQLKFAEAIPVVTEVIELSPDNAEAYVNRGICYSEQKQYDLALNYYNQAITLNPKYAEAYGYRGLCYLNLKGYKQAVNDFTTVILLIPDCADAYYYRGLCYLNLQEYKQAVNDFTTVIKLIPDYANSYYYRGLCYFNLQEYEKALDYLDNVESLYPYFFYSDFSKLKEDVLDELIKRNPNKSCYYLRRVDFFKKLLIEKHDSFVDINDIYNKLLKDAIKLIELNPNESKYYSDRADCYKQLEKYEEAIADFDKAIKLSETDNLEFYSNRADCYKQLKKYEEELTDLTKLIELNSNKNKYYSDRAECYQHLGQYQEASNDFDKAFELSSSEFLEKKNDYLFSSDTSYSVNNIFQLLLTTFSFYLEFKQNEKALESFCEYMRWEETENKWHNFKYPVNHLNFVDKAIILKNYDVVKKCVQVMLAKKYEVDKAKQYLELIKELEEKNKKIEDMQCRMQKLVAQFTHSLHNTIFPNTIHQVAERLKNNIEYRRDTLLLRNAYQSEKLIKLQADLLRQRYANTEPEKFRNIIRGCRRNANTSDNTKSILDILNYAISRVVGRFLNQYDDALKTIRNQISSKTNSDINQLRQKFEDDILLDSITTPLEWVTENLRPIQTQFSPMWQNVFILSESYAESLLFGYFSEILFNAFKYADHNADNFLNINFTEKCINDIVYLVCTWTNPMTNKKLVELGTNEGLEAIAEDLKQLNNTDKREQSLLIQQQDNQFHISLFFNKELLIDDLPILKRKRKTAENNNA